MAEERVIKFNGPLDEFFWDETSLICLLEGAAGTGKTFCYLHKALRVAEENPGVRIVFSRKERVDLTEILSDFEAHILPPRHPVKPKPRDAKPPARKYYYFPNGSVIVCVGMEDRSDNDDEEAGKFKSTAYDLWFIEEATECSFDEIQTAFSRLRADGITWKQLVLAFNPPSDPDHHIYRFVGWPNTKYYKTVHEDNPRYWEPCADGDAIHPITKKPGKWTPKGAQYIQGILGSLQGGIGDRFSQGKNARQPGLMHPEFSMQRHTVNEDGALLTWLKQLALTPEQKTKWMRDNLDLGIGIDWGAGHPQAHELWAEMIDGSPWFDGSTMKHRRILEFYRTATISDEAGKEFLNYCGYDYCEETEEYSYIENELGFVIPLLSESFEQEVTVVTDHSLESRLLFTRATGFDTILAPKAVLAGTALISKLLREDKLLFDLYPPIGGIDIVQHQAGKPIGMHQEFSKYKRQKGPQGFSPNPIRQNDDGNTASRYYFAFKYGLRDDELSTKDVGLDMGSAEVQFESPTPKNYGVFDLLFASPGRKNESIF